MYLFVCCVSGFVEVFLGVGVGLAFFLVLCGLFFCIFVFGAVVVFFCQVLFYFS